MTGESAGPGFAEVEHWAYEVESPFRSPADIAALATRTEADESQREETQLEPQEAARDTSAVGEDPAYEWEYRWMADLYELGNFEDSPYGEIELLDEVDRRSRAYAGWAQQSLNQVAGAGLASDGKIGPLSRAAIRRFQAAHGLTADGIVGAKTEAALVAAGATAPPGAPRTPAFAPDDLDTALFEDEDEVEQAEQAVEQSAVGTLEMLVEAETGAGSSLAERVRGVATFVLGPTLRRGSRGPPVAALQRALGSLGYDIAVDGDFGPNTERAVRVVQGRLGLPVDGMVGPRSKSGIAAALAGRGQAAAAHSPGGAAATRATSASPNARPELPVHREMLEGDFDDTELEDVLEQGDVEEFADEAFEELLQPQQDELTAARRSPLRIPEGIEVRAEAHEDYDEEASLLQLGESLDEQYDGSPTVSQGISDALRKKDWARGLELAIQEGWRDENKLTNLLFFDRHPELGGRRLDPATNEHDRKLSEKWARILTREVWPAIVRSAANPALATAGKDVTSGHRQFWGKEGKEFKDRVEWAAKEVGLNPGLLAANLLAETGSRRDYLTKSKVRSYRIGLDDFYDLKAALSRKVPAYFKIGWDRNQKPDVHLNDAKKPRAVKTIRFNSGRDGLLASAVYLKYGEIHLRDEAKRAGGDFDGLPIETRFALVRMTFTAGREGARQRLVRALKGEDILARVNKPLKKYQTERNATVRAAQALHLSDWIFGVRPAEGVQPELEQLEDGEASAFASERDERL